jgi:hypothetical protein
MMTKEEFAKLYPPFEENDDPIVFESPILMQKPLVDRMSHEGIKTIPEGSGEGVLERP